MKKGKLLFVLMMVLLPCSSLSLNADPTDIILNVGYVDPSDPKDDDPRSPIQIPEVGIEDYTITFHTPCDGCLLILVDENEDIVYSTVIPTGATTLVLPSYLSGEYEIRIIQENLCFWGYINL